MVTRFDQLAQLPEIDTAGRVEEIYQSQVDKPVETSNAAAHAVILAKPESRMMIIQLAQVGF